MKWINKTKLTQRLNENCSEHIWGVVKRSPLCKWVVQPSNQTDNDRVADGGYGL